MNIAATKTDSQIKADVLAELKWDTRVDETEVGVQVGKGIVTLTGDVSAYFKKLAAREAAHRVAGVLDVVDELRVRLPRSMERTDEDVARAVRDGLRWDSLVPADRITTTVSSGNVTLQGTVETWTQRVEAERAVQRLAGVVSVNNELVVAPTPVNSDKLRFDIEQALERQAEREARRIGVVVKDGVVKLTGSVHSWAEKNAVDRVAGFAPGVRRVDDLLVVDPYF